MEKHGIIRDSRTVLEPVDSSSHCFIPLFALFVILRKREEYRAEANYGIHFVFLIIF